MGKLSKTRYALAFEASCLLRYGDKYDYSKVKYVNANEPIIIGCPTHGEVEVTPKQHLKNGGTGCIKCDDEIAKTKRKSGKYSKRKGSNYENEIARELREVCCPGVVTSRSESKRMDDKKVDLVDTEGKLPFYVQLKKTKATPNYFKIREESGLTAKPFCLIWNR